MTDRPADPGSRPVDPGSRSVDPTPDAGAVGRGAPDTGPPDAESSPGVDPWAARRPPPWLPRALTMAVVAVFVGLFLWDALWSLRSLAVNLLIALFLALALEPMVVWLVRHRWPRGAAAGAALLGALLGVSVLIALFGNLFVQQLTSLVQSIPDLYATVRSWLHDSFGITVPKSSTVIDTLVKRYGQDVATGAITVGSALLSAVFALFTVLLVTYYLLAAGPRFRRAVCAWLTPNRQQDVLMLWEVTQVKVSDFIASRVVLAGLSSAFTFVFLTIVGTPYALPLALFTGLVSQFIPTIGTYIGGALPCLVALTSQGIPQMIAVLAFIVAYQQLENLYFSPKISARALEMNPAVSFIVVIGFGAVFGPLGAFLSLPIAATVQAVATTYFQRHELVESHMLHDPAAGRPAKKSARGRPSQAGLIPLRSTGWRRFWPRSGARDEDATAGGPGGGDSAGPEGTAAQDGGGHEPASDRLEP